MSNKDELMTICFYWLSLFCFLDSNLIETDKWLFNQQALQEYILCCCQDKYGGLIDKPERKRDYYHTCYGLSGLSVAQFSFTNEIIVGPLENKLVSFCLSFMASLIQCVIFYRFLFIQFIIYTWKE